MTASEIDDLHDEIAVLRASLREMASVLEAAHGQGVDEERTAVVAWLRWQAESTSFRPMGCHLADAIERGEHRREEER